MKPLAAAAFAWLAGSAAAQTAATDLAYRAALAAAPGHSHYRFALPAAVYAGIERADLGDLRVLNARGEPVPFAFLPRRQGRPAPVQVQSAKLYPLYGEQSKGLEGVKLDVARDASGTVIRLAAEPKARSGERKLLGYLLDASTQKLPVEALTLEWQTRASFSGAVRVEASEDLSHWSALVAQAPVLALEHAGERLERRRVEFPARSVKYLRLSFSRVPEDFVLAGVALDQRGERVEPAREWQRLPGAAVPDKPGEYRFESGGRFPADRVRLGLPQQNTVARVQVLARDRDEAQWRTVASATVFRLLRNGAEAAGPDVELTPTADRHWLLRADPRGGGLGAGEVSLEIGWLPHEIVFAARGDAPFTLAFGSKLAKPEALAVGAVVPGYRDDKELLAAEATLGEVTGAAPVRPSLSDPLGMLRALLESGELKRWALWASLLAGVLAVAWMALRLLRDVGKGAPPGSAD
jgi:hypothetical protein